MNLIVAITGASGIILAKRLLEVLKEKNIETYLIISSAAKKVMELEGVPYKDLQELCTKEYPVDKIESSIASGSFKTDGMVVIPCSMKTLAGLASGYSENLILRAGDVCLKEGRKLILVPRETPLSLIHLRNMAILKQAGAVILPPNLTFYQEPKNLDDMINFILGKVLDSLKIENKLYNRWK